VSAQEPSGVTLPKRFLGVSLKMYFDHSETIMWTKDVVAAKIELEPSDLVSVVLFPSFPSIPATVELVGGTGILVGAQNISQFDQGPFTGEVCGRTIRQTGCAYVEIGHSERRMLFGEDDRVIQQKLSQALSNELIPVLCIGEPQLDDAAEGGEYCINQLRAALNPILDQSSDVSIVIAYEPVYSIGADEPASDYHIRTVCGMVKRFLAASWPKASMRVVYGGSAGPGLFTRIAGIADGLFLGRYAHDSLAFSEILSEAMTV